MTTENLPALFQELEVPSSIQDQLTGLGAEFSDLSIEDKREFIVYKIEQAALTTEGVKIKLPIAKLLHGDACMIRLPGDKAVSDFKGVILDQYLTKAFWEDEDADGSRPDCQSVGGFKPAEWVKEPQNGLCASCPHNKFGSALKGKGKRCKDSKRLVIRDTGEDGGNLPFTLQVPSTVLTAIDSYLRDCFDAGTELGTMVTEFTARPKTNQQSGKVSTTLEFVTDRGLTVPEILKLKREFVDPNKADFRIGSFENFGGEDDDTPETPEEKKASAAMSAADHKASVL